MKYYFTLSKENVKNFYSSTWIVRGEERIFGGGVILKTPKNDNKLSRCSLLGSSDTRTLFEIDLSEDDIHEDMYVTRTSKTNYIILVKLTNNKNVTPLLFTSLHCTTEFFDKNVEEPYHYYHFAVTLREKLILTNGKDERVKSIRILNILNDDRKTVELPVFNEGLMCRPNGTIFYTYSVKIPDKYLESFLIGRESFMKILYLSDSAMYTNTMFNENTAVITIRPTDNRAIIPSNNNIIIVPP